MAQEVTGPRDIMLQGTVIRITAGQVAAFGDNVTWSDYSEADEYFTARDAAKDAGETLPGVGDTVEGGQSLLNDNGLTPDQSPSAFVSESTPSEVWTETSGCVAGQVYAHNNREWICRQTHTAQANWHPGSPGTDALWTLVAISNVWEAGVQYMINDEVFYPAENTDLYRCLQSHQSQVGWEPPNVPSLWSAI